MKIGVICSDARMIQVADNLAADHQIIRIQEDTDFLALPQLDALVLPIKGMNDEHQVQLWDAYVHIPSCFWQIQGKGLCLFQGLPNAASRKLGLAVDYYMQAEKVIEQNAILTAEGVLNELIGHTCKSLYALSIDVVGYGHCGKAIYEMLKNLHAKVRVIRRQCEKQGDFCPIVQWEECGDVIIYTAPTNLITNTQLKTWKKQPLILDIATPVIFSEEECKQLNLNYHKISNLPGRYACISAGNIIAEHIRGKLHEK